MPFLPEVVGARYEGDYRIRVRFNDGSEDVVDCEQWLWGSMLEPLLDRALFRQFFVEGGSVAWPNGADIAPETLYAAMGRAAQPARDH